MVNLCEKWNFQLFQRLAELPHEIWIEILILDSFYIRGECWQRIHMWRFSSNSIAIRSLSISSHYQQSNVTLKLETVETSPLITFDVCCLHSYRDFTIHAISLDSTHGERFYERRLRWDRVSYVLGWLITSAGHEIRRTSADHETKRIKTRQSILTLILGSEFKITWFSPESRNEAHKLLFRVIAQGRYQITKNNK